MSQSFLPSTVVKDFVKSYWSERAATFDESPNHCWQNERQHRAWLDILDDIAGPTPIDVLDLGAGTGFLSLMLAELGHRVTGVDIAPPMVMSAERKAQDQGRAATFRLGDIEQLPDDENTYDLIVGRHIIWTLPNPHEALRDWLRVLRPGGKLALVEFAARSGPDGQERRSAPGYEEYAPALPFYGGSESTLLIDTLREAGFHHTMAKSLMDPILWGIELTNERYVVTGRKPGTA